MPRKRRVRIPFFTDQNVPDSVGRRLMEAGHEVTRLRDVMETDTADPVIEVACSEAGQVLVTHDNDFRAAARRLRVTQRQYHNSLHRIQLRCTEPHSASRIVDALSLIEHEWGLPRGDRPMVVEIHELSLKVLR